MMGLIFDAVVTWLLIKVNGDVSSLIPFMAVMCMVTVMRTSWWIISDIRYGYEEKLENKEEN